MSTGTALVNARTPNAAPQDQRGGTYAYTPPEVIGYLNGETLSNAELQQVTRFFDGKLPSVVYPEPALAEVSPVTTSEGTRRVQSPPALAAPYTGKLKAKGPKQPSGTLSYVAMQLIAFLHDDEAYDLLISLADRFNLEIE